MPTTDEKLKERLLERTQQMLEATVEDVMTQNVLSCDYNDFSAKAARLILENAILGVLVMKDGKPFSMVTTFDLLNLGYEEVFDPSGAQRAQIDVQIEQIRQRIRTANQRR